MVAQKTSIKIFVILILTAVFIQIFNFLPVRAQDTSKKVEVVDATTVIYDGRTFVDTNPYDATYQWEYKTEEFTCGADVLKIINREQSNATFEYYHSVQVPTGCNKPDVLKNIPAVNHERIDVFGYKIGTDGIYLSTGFKIPVYSPAGIGNCSAHKPWGPPLDWVDRYKPGIFKNTSTNDTNVGYDKNVFYSSTYSTTDLSLSLSGEYATFKGKCSAAKFSALPDYTVSIDNIRVLNKDQINESVAKVYGFTKNADGSYSAPNDTETEKSSSEGLGDCASIVPKGWGGKLNPASWVSNTLDWFGCTVIKGVLGFADNLNKEIDGFLATDTDTYLSSSVHDSWGRFLLIGNFLFVIAFLLMILSTALGIGVFDAYTVKKFLPRIIIAAILANLSFEIVKVLIGTTNELGGAVQQIILGPVGKTDLFKTAQAAVATGSARGIIGTGVGIAAGFAITGLATGGIFALIPAALAILFAVIVAWAVITIRRVIILLLIVVAPLAIALWAVPGADAWAKRWWKLFIEMLLVYPIVKGIIAAGMFTASLVYKTAKTQNGDVNMGEALTVIGAIILPYVLLPTVFKMASSTLSNITGMVNSKGKGVFDRGSKWGKERAAESNKSLSKKGLKSEKLKLRGQRQTADALNQRLTGRGIRSRMYQRGLEPGAQASLRASADAVLINGAAEGHIHERTSGDELVAIATNQDASRHERQAALKAMAMQQDGRNLLRAQQTMHAQGGESQAVYDDVAGANYKEFATASAAAVARTSEPDYARQRSTAYDSTSLEELAGFSTRQWDAFYEANPHEAVASHARMLNEGTIIPSYNTKIKMRNVPPRWAPGGGGPAGPAPGGPIPGGGGPAPGGPIPGGGGPAPGGPIPGGGGPAGPAPGGPIPGGGGGPAGPAPGGPIPGGGGGPAGPAPGGGGVLPSDARLKRDIRLIESRHGISLYRFKYLWSNQEYVGVMAQDIAKSHPNAVVKNGEYLMVDYSAIGVEMMEYEDWCSRK